MCIMSVQNSFYVPEYCKSLSGVYVRVGTHDAVFIVTVKDSRRNQQTEQAVSVTQFFSTLCYMKTPSLVP